MVLISSYKMIATIGIIILLKNEVIAYNATKMVRLINALFTIDANAKNSTNEVKLHKA